MRCYPIDFLLSNRNIEDYGRAMQYDYIIVGAGTAGCVLANRLSADRNVRVALLEAGGKDDYFWINIPIGYLYTIGNPRTDWCFSTQREPGLNNRSLDYARGRVLGGCSSINAMIYMRGQKTDYDHWAELGNRGWSWDDVLPVFKKSESYQHGGNEFHGASGELKVAERRVSWEILDAWRDAAEHCGIPKVDEFNRGDNFGNAYFQMNQRRGMRWSAAHAFLRPVQNRPNLDIITNAHVQKLQITKNESDMRATHVEFSIDGQSIQSWEARREVILAAGAIGSPQLLQLSGIGPGELLSDHGIRVHHHLPGIGENLHDHLQLRSVYKVQNTITLNQRANSLLGKISMAMEFAIRRTGPLTMPPSQLGGFAKSNHSELTPNIEWHVQPLSLDKFGDKLHSFNAITPSVCDIRPTSRGYVRINSPKASVPPLIAPKYLSTEKDRKTAIEGLRFTRRIMAAPALTRFQPEEWKPGANIQNDEELLHAAGDIGSTIFHPVGTCKMGRDPLAVVSDRLKVHGISGLRVVDASIMPRITSGNTNAPTVMIAEQGASFIQEEAAAKTR